MRLSAAISPGGVPLALCAYKMHVDTTFLAHLPAVLVTMDTAEQFAIHCKGEGVVGVGGCGALQMSSVPSIVPHQTQGQGVH